MTEARGIPARDWKTRRKWLYLCLTLPRPFGGARTCQRRRIEARLQRGAAAADMTQCFGLCRLCGLDVSLSVADNDRICSGSKFQQRRHNWVMGCCCGIAGT
eukprot:3184249-Pleurochrysis_carterae.AAC.7